MNKLCHCDNLEILRKFIRLVFCAFITLICGSLLFTIGCRAADKAKGLPDETNLKGNWTGESICQVKNSPCHDEKVIYRITKPDSSGKLTVQMDKIVDGKAEMMGVLDCRYDQAVKTLVCKMPNGVWEFTVAGNQMKGTLTLTDKTLYRRISVKKDE